MTEEKKKPIPRFASEDEEREFWANHDTTEYEWGEPRRARFPNLEPTFKEVSFSLHEKLLKEIELMAEKQGIPVETLIEKYLSERILEEREVEEAG